MRNRVYRRITLRPRPDFRLKFGGNFLERHARFRAMLADQAGLDHVAREERQQRGAATGRFAIGRRRRRQPLEPDLAVMRQLRRQPARAQQWMRQAPGAAFELAERLRQPARQREVIEVAENFAIFLPQPVKR